MSKRHGRSADLPPLVRDIYAATDDMRVRVAMLFGALEEGGSWTGPWPEGDVSIGGSYGPFQIYMKAHPDVTPQQASDPAFAVHYMLHGYERAVAQIPNRLWRRNPALAAEEATYLAERPAQTYVSSRGMKQVKATYHRAAELLGGNAAAVGGPAAASGQPAAPSGGTPNAQDSGFHIPNPIAGAGKDIVSGMLNLVPEALGIGSFRDMMERLGLLIIGFTLLGIGLVVMFRDSAPAERVESGQQLSDDATNDRRAARSQQRQDRSEGSSGGPGMWDRFGPEGGGGYKPGSARTARQANAQGQRLKAGSSAASKQTGSAAAAQRVAKVAK